MNKNGSKADFEEFPGYDEISEIMAVAQKSVEGLDVARRILIQLACKARSIHEAKIHYKLYQLALEDIGESFDHLHISERYQ